MGSPDVYNSIEFYWNNMQIASFIGSQLINPATGDWATGDYVNFDVQGGYVDSIVMKSSQAAFETDNHAFSAVPEPMTFGVAGTALAVMAGVLRRRRNKE